MIVGIKEEGNVVLAFSTFDGFIPVSISDMEGRENAGIWKIKGTARTLMGCVVPTAESDAYRYEEKTFKGPLDSDSLIRKILPAMEQLTSNKGYIGDENGRFDEFLIAQKDRLFHITGEHIVLEVDSAIAIAAYGEDFAKGALFATEGMPTTKRIQEVFEFAARERQCDPYPIAVMDTAAGKLKFLKRGHD